MKIRFVSNLPEGEKGFYCDYNYVQSRNPSWTYCDARPHAQPHQDQWLDDLGRWHASVCQIAARATPFWWFTPLSRVIAFQPIIFHDVLYARGIVEMCRSSDFTELYLVGFPKRIKKYIQDFDPTLICEEDEAIPSKQGKQSSFLKRMGSRLSQILFLVGKMAWNSLNLPRPKKAKTLIFSLCLDSDHFKKTGDHFFHDLFDNLPGFVPENFYWFYIPNSGHYGDQRLFKKALKQKGVAGSTLYDWIVLTDIFYLLRKLPAIRKELKKVAGHFPPLNLGSLNSQSFTEDFGREAAENNRPVVELLVYRAAQRVVKTTAPRSVIYPYEGKGLERAFLRACVESGSDLHRIAYAHAIYNPGLLYMRFHHEILAKPLVPDTIACSGPRQLQWLSTWCRISPKRLTLIGSSRYTNPIPLKRNESQRRQSLRILMIAGLSHEVEQMANLVRKNRNLFENCHLTVRKYPYSWREEQAKTLDELKTFYPECESPDLPLLTQLTDCDVVLISSTSTALEAMLSHRPVIYLDLHGIIDLNPFRHKGEISSVKQCHTPQNLKEAFYVFRTMGQTEYENMVRTQAVLASEFFTPPLQREIARLLNPLITAEKSSSLSTDVPLARAI